MGIVNKLNFYWFFLIIAVIFFSIQLMSFNMNSKETSWREFNHVMLQNHDVEKVVILNKTTVQIYIKEEALRKEKYKSVSQKTFGSGVNKGPHYFFEMPPEIFEEKLEEAQSNFNKEDKIDTVYKTQKTMIEDILSWTFPILILVIIFFIARKITKNYRNQHYVEKPKVQYEEKPEMIIENKVLYHKDKLYKPIKITNIVMFFIFLFIEFIERDAAGLETGTAWLPVYITFLISRFFVRKIYSKNPKFNYKIPITIGVFLSVFILKTIIISAVILLVP